MTCEIEPNCPPELVFTLRKLWTSHATISLHPTTRLTWSWRYLRAFALQLSIGTCAPQPSAQVLNCSAQAAFRPGHRDRHFRRPASPRARHASQPHFADHRGQPGRLRRSGPAPGPLPWATPGILDESIVWQTKLHHQLSRCHPRAVRWLRLQDSCQRIRHEPGNWTQARGSCG